MKCMDCDQSKGPSTMAITEVDTPTYDKNTEVLIKIEATGCNRAELLHSYGKYPPPPGATKIIGLECAGYLVDPSTDQVTDKRVMALLAGGGYSQFARVNKDHIIDIPEELTFE